LLVFIGSIFLIFINGFVIMPPSDMGEFTATLSINGAVPYGRTHDSIARGIHGAIEEELGDAIYMFEISYSTGGNSMMLFSGGSGPRYSISVALKDKRGGLTTDEAVQRVDDALMEYLRVEGLLGSFIGSVAVDGNQMNMGADSVVVTFTHENPLNIGAALMTLQPYLEEIDGVFRVSNNFRAGAIRRRNGENVGSLNVRVDINANLSQVQGLVDAEVARVMELEKYADIFADVETREDGFAADFADTFAQLGLAMLIGFVLMYLVMVAMFQSFITPLIVLITVPLAFTGGFILLAMVGMPLSIAAIVGFMILMGVIINNGIVLIDYINKARADGLSIKEALVASANVRARPIIMTAVSTILALIPLAVSLGASGGMMQPLAIVSIGGLVYATLMTLFVVPAFYAIFIKEKGVKNEKKKRGQNNRRKLEDEHVEATGAVVLTDV
jgi:multidrug efflux pump subunit AcrB